MTVQLLTPLAFSLGLFVGQLWSRIAARVSFYGIKYCLKPIPDATPVRLPFCEVKPHDLDVRCVCAFSMQMPLGSLPFSLPPLPPSLPSLLPVLMLCRHLRVPPGQNQELGGETAATGSTIPRVPFSKIKGMHGEGVINVISVLKPVVLCTVCTKGHMCAASQLPPLPGLSA